MSFKSDIAVLGIIGIAAYAGYRVVGNLFTGGGLDPFSLLGVGGGAGKTDIFGNTTTAYIDKQLGEAKQAAADQNAAIAKGEALMATYDYGKELEDAYSAYAKEDKEYNDMLREFNPTYSFWTGKEDAETVAYRRQLEKEYAEANLAYNDYTTILAKWQARNS